MNLHIVSAHQGKYGIRLRASKNGSEQTLVYYDRANDSLVMDTTHSGPEGRRVVERAPFRLKAGEVLRLQIFVDKSVVEVFANDRQAITRRVYPTQKDSLGISVFAEPGTKINQIEGWTMSPSNPY